MVRNHGRAHLSSWITSFAYKHRAALLPGTHYPVAGNIGLLPTTTLVMSTPLTNGSYHVAGLPSRIDTLALRSEFRNSSTEPAGEYRYKN